MPLEPPVGELRTGHLHYHRVAGGAQYPPGRLDPYLELSLRRGVEQDAVGLRTEGADKTVGGNRLAVDPGEAEQDALAPDIGHLGGQHPA